MCGIVGYITNNKDKKELKEIIKRMLVLGESRGTDATGIATLTDHKSVRYLKAPLRARKFVEGKGFKKFEFNDVLIAHNRHSTGGSPKDNNNNHPVVSKSGIAIVHNGFLSNDDAVKKKFELKTDGKVDTEIILRMVEKKLDNKRNIRKAIKEAMKEMSGSATFGLIDCFNPNTLYLARDSNPLHLAYVEKLNTIFFASEEGIIRSALSETKKVLGLFTISKEKYDTAYYEVKDETLVTLNKENGTFKKTIEKAKMKAYGYTYIHPRYIDFYDETGWEEPKNIYQEKRGKEKGEKYAYGNRYAKCPYCERQFVNEGYLFQHIRTYHPDRVEEYLETHPLDKREIY